mmetsp:Transcript_49081/g.128132  ORF Transcript_49081/g.128132 Transcript_49081/m.128132 type:complete len:103 (-) Transcript_49081:53-361(-)
MARPEADNNVVSCDGHSYRKLQMIGRGRFGTVRLCKRDDGQLFAVKVFGKPQLAKQRQYEPSTGGFKSMLENIGDEIADATSISHAAAALHELAPLPVGLAP